MKLLFISTNHEHANEMHINNIHGLMEVAQVDFWGPGFSCQEELEKGLKSYWYEEGPYDALILDFSLAMLQMPYLDIRLAYHWHRYFMSDYSIYEAVRYADQIVEDTKEIDCPKLLYYMFDPFSISETWIKCITELLDAGFYYWGLGEEYVPEIEETSQTKVIGWGNRYLHFCKKYRNKIISMLWCTVTHREFYGAPLEKRKYDITVPGNVDPLFYPDRIEILNKVKEAGYNIYDCYNNRTHAYRESENRIKDTIYEREEDRVLDEKLVMPCQYMQSRLTRESIVMWRENYNVGLREAKMGYADGGLSLQILRKYVEVPARGTLLLCQNIPPLECYGFEEWKNMVSVTPDTVIEICDYLLKHPKEMQNIASEGRRMVYEKHLSVTHAKHILTAIEAIKKGDFYGSYWEKGHFCIKTLK